MSERIRMRACVDAAMMPSDEQILSFAEKALDGDRWGGMH